MDYEKAYKEALERARQFSDKPYLEDSKGIVDYIFPELQEREDERMLNQLHSWMKEFGCAEEYTEKVYQWIKGLLEKQGEQKPADKIEPKFEIKEGMWYVCTQTYVLRGKIVVIKNQTYKSNQDGAIEGEDGHLFVDKIDDKALNYFRPWTIEDANDGDVLACESGWTCIFKTLVNDETFSSYCFMDNTKWFCETGSECHTLREEFVKAYNGKIHPATKEQRDILMKAMVDAGYTFDFAKKELKKIEQKPIWSEDVEDAITLLKDIAEEQEKDYCQYNANNLRKAAQYLETCRPQNTWKPSEEQIKAVKEAACYSSVFSEKTIDNLIALSKQLKKLREE